MATRIAVMMALTLGCGIARAAGVAHHPVARVEGAGLRSLIAAGGFEEADAPAGWGKWGDGFALDENVAHSGRRSARCTRAAASPEMGVQRDVRLNQESPRDVVVTAWSRAEGVSGAPDSGYSLYVDVLYTDGSHDWGLSSSFRTGTHDWEQRKVVVRAGKPIASLLFYGLFRGHEGTVWFDDFEAGESRLASGSAVFDYVAITPRATEANAPSTARLATGDGLVLNMASDGGIIADGRVGGFLVRDAEKDSDIRRLTGAYHNGSFSAADPELGLSLDAKWSTAANHIRVRGTLTDTVRRGPRAVTLYLAIPVPGADLQFGLDPRRSVPVDRASETSNSRSCSAGQAQRVTWYPFAPVMSLRSGGLAIGLPLESPRLARLAYNAKTEELFAAIDLALVPGYRRLPSAADFDLVVYQFDPAWGFRSALARYYAIFPDDFQVRVREQGIWMPFTAISGVQGWEDFGFRFKEGDDEPAWDGEHGILTFPYVEPSSNWLPLPKDVPRTVEAAEAYLRSHLDAPINAATLTSGLRDATQALRVGIENAPWCDGAIYLLNPSPNVAPSAGGKPTKWSILSGPIGRATTKGAGAAAGWNPYGSGYTLDTTTVHNGRRAIRADSDGQGQFGARQTLQLNQEAARPVMVSGWSRASNVSGGAPADYSIYVDCVLAEGTSLYGNVAAFAGGTHGWQQASVRIDPAKPIRQITVHAILRGLAKGTAWFDDISVDGAAPPTNPGFEDASEVAAVAGIYVDSLEMAAWDLNYSADHIAYSTIPPTFDLEFRPTLLHGWSVAEFTRRLAETLHAEGKWTFSNGALWTAPWYARDFDVMGTETSWGSDSDFRPDPDDVFCYRRAMSYRKPYLLLQNTRYDSFGTESVKRYFERSLFYGAWPSMFSHDAANDPYWQNPKWYNRDRPLFRKYIPLVRKLAEAGWEPITWAWSRTDGVLVERWGTGRGTILTVMRDSASPADATVDVDLDQLGWKGATQVVDAITGEKTAVSSPAGGRASLRLSLAGWQTRMLALE